MSITRAELEINMKEDARRAWEKIKNTVKHYATYGLMAIGLSSGLSGELPASVNNYTQKMQNNQQKLENRIKIKEIKAQQKQQGMSEKKREVGRTYTNWREAASRKYKAPWQKEDINEKAESIYQQNRGEKIDGSISVQELMDKVGVTKADIQAVIDKNPEMLMEISGGEINRKLAQAANKARYDGTRGKCTLGVQTMFANAGMGEINAANNPNWPPKERGAEGSNSACNMHIVLERSGEFTTVHIPNKAYSRRGSTEDKSKENQEMNDFIERLASGTPISIDNKVDEYRGRALPTNNQGIIHGHTGIINDRHNLACDFEQINGVNFGRYGKNVNISIAKDSGMSKDLAKECIKAKLEREQRVAQQEQQKMAYLGR